MSQETTDTSSQSLPPVPPTCAVCGAILRTGSKYNVCTRTAACKSEYNRQAVAAFKARGGPASTWRDETLITLRSSVPALEARVKALEAKLAAQAEELARVEDAAARSLRHLNDLVKDQGEVFVKRFEELEAWRRSRPGVPGAPGAPAGPYPEPVLPNLPAPRPPPVPSLPGGLLSPWAGPLSPFAGNKAGGQ